MLNDVVKFLERWDVWKAVAKSPARIDALEKRVAILEAMFAAPPGKPCPKCRKPAFVVEKSVPSRGPFGPLGHLDRTYVCPCGYSEVRTEDPSE